MILSLKNYKLAKVMLKDLTVAVQKIDHAITELTPYLRYKPIMRILHSLKDEKAILNSHIQSFQKIVNDKGKMKEETP